MSELPRSWYWGPAKATGSDAERARREQEEARESHGVEERVVVKRTWLRGWWRKRRVRQTFQIVDYGTELTGAVWAWVDVAVLPDLPKARIR
jgi:hypothetical protein